MAQKITNKTEIMSKFEDQEYVHIRFPQEMEEDEPIYMRSEIQSLDHFNCIYKDGNKYYLEDFTDACIRVLKRIFGQDVDYDCMMLEKASAILYYAENDMKQVKKVYHNIYG